MNIIELKEKMQDGDELVVTCGLTRVYLKVVLDKEGLKIVDLYDFPSINSKLFLMNTWEILPRKIVTEFAMLQVVGKKHGLLVANYNSRIKEGVKYKLTEVKEDGK